MRFDPALRDEVVARYQKLNLPAYWSGINADLTAQFDSGGQIEKVGMNDPSDPVARFLRYGAMYDRGLLRAGSAR